MNENAKRILTEISSLGKRFLLSEVLSIFSSKYPDNQLLKTIEAAKTEGILKEKKGIFSFQDDEWKKFYESTDTNEKDHLELALQRQLPEGIKFHLENSHCSKRTFAAALLWQIRKDYYNWLPKDKLLKKIEVVDYILGYENWASLSLKARLIALDYKKIATRRLIEKWLRGNFHVDCMNFLRILKIHLDKQLFLELVSERTEGKLTDYQKIVLQFYLLDTKNIKNLSKADLEKLEILNKESKTISPQYARLKIAILNLFAGYFGTKEPVKGKLFLEMALKIAKEFNLKDWIAKLYNNLSLYYEEDFKAYSEELKLNAIEVAGEINDYDTAAFIAVNLAYSYLASGEKILLNKLMKKINAYVKTTNNPEIKSRILEFKSLTALYNGNSDEFERCLAEYEANFEITKDPRVLSKKYFTNVLKILFHIINGDIKAIQSVFENLTDAEYLEDDERKFLEITKIGLSNPTEAYMLFRKYRKGMRFFVEETLLFLAQILPESFLEDFREFSFSQLAYSRKRGLLLSQAQIYHAIGLAAYKSDMQHDVIRYMRFAASLYDASGMNNLSRKLRNLFLNSEAFVDLMIKVKENLEKAGIDKHLLNDLNNSVLSANDSLRFIGRIVAVVLSFANAENFNELAEVIFKSLLEEFPANVGRFEFGKGNVEICTFGTGEIPTFDTLYTPEPFYVSYSFYVGNNDKAKLELYNPEQKVDQLTIQKFYNLMVHLEPIIELMLLNFSRYRMAIRDELTGLYTRWYFEERFKEEFARANRTGEIFSLIFCDLDDFKKINDNYGHKTGDEVLKNVARIFMKNARETDIICRFGGEEFVFLLPGTSHNGAKIFAERLRESIENARINVSVTGSFGVVTYPSPYISSREEILRIADDLCYKAKKAGKNSVKG